MPLTLNPHTMSALNKSHRPIRIAINGYGRIGRSVLRALYESADRKKIQVVAINEPADIDTIIHLTKYDSTHGRFSAQVGGDSTSKQLIVNGDHIALSGETELTQLPWAKHQVDRSFRVQRTVCQQRGITATHPTRRS